MNTWVKDYLKRSRLSFKFLFAILLCSVVFAFATSVLQYYLGYKKEMRKVEEVMILIHESYLEPMSNSLWSFDINQMEIQAQGILSFPNIKKVVVYELFGGKENPVCSLGGIEDKAYVKQSFQLNFKSQGISKHIGKLIVFAGLDNIREDIKHKVLGSFVVKVVEILILCAFVLLIFQAMVLKHLNRIQRYLNDTATASLGRTLTLDRKQDSQKDIFDTIVDSINVIVERFSSTRAQTKDLSEELDKTHRESEQAYATMDMFEQMRTVEDDVAAILHEDLGVEPLSQKLINYMCRYFGAGVGLFYCVDEEKGLIRAVAGYAVALSREKPIEFGLGEGQVGQAVLNRAPFLMHRQEESSLIIYSSLGQAKSDSILIFPFSKQGRVTCVMEMGSFSVFDRNHVQVLNRISERVALAVEFASIKEEKKALERQIGLMDKPHAPV